MKKITYSKIGDYKSVLVAIIFILSLNLTVKAQEVKFMGSGQVYSGLTGAFIGPSVGFETSIGNHFTLNSDFSLGFNSKGKAFEFKPSVLYYISKKQSGFFIGPSLKYVSIKEKNNVEFYDDNLYAVGLSLGFKTPIKGKFNMIFGLSPHYSIGSSSKRGDLGSAVGISFNTGISYKL